MRRILLLLLLGLLLSFGCTQSKPSPSNVSNVSNYTAPPSPPPNATGKAVIPPGYEIKDYCVQDSDCVRQRKCCDCGIGEYVNFYNLEDPVCAGPSCACPIMRSNGACVNNKCVAVPYNETQTGGEFYFRANQSGNCGTESVPTKNVTPYGTTMVGYVSTPNPCYTAEASTETGDNGTLIVRITTKPLLSIPNCIQCVGAVGWYADVGGFNGSVEIYYDGRRVYSDVDKFCGWTSGSCSKDSDCMTSGCFQEVCQSSHDPPTITNCNDNRDCYKQDIYKVHCGCAASRCAWIK